MQTLTTDILIIGGTTSGTAAAIQAARQGAAQGTQVTLISEFEWLGGMLTSAGVAAPDGNELRAWHTGLWGAFLQELQQQQPGGLNNAWVSLFTYEPRLGADIFANWVNALPNLTWIPNQTAQSVQRSATHITGVTTQDYTITAKLTIDATELGDLLALGNIPHRWGWELQNEFNEPSAPTEYQDWMHRYPIQVPTWVVILQDYGLGNSAPAIPKPENFDFTCFEGAWENYGGEKFLNYGRLPGDRFMINWPIHGNDYGEGVDRIIGTEAQRTAYAHEAQRHSLAFAYWIQQKLGNRYGLAENVFPSTPSRLHPSLALHPYHRESRRLKGITTVREQDLLPATQATAPLPFHISAMGCDQVDLCCTPIVIGNYANDHHYPSGDIPLAPKSIPWGGRWTGTPFTIPFTALIPEQLDGFLSCEKNISITHMANGATRLQPVVLNLGQAAGMAAALCIQHQMEPRDLPVRLLQNALITDPIAPAALIPLYNLSPQDPQWHFWQNYYLDHPESYPRKGNAPQISLPTPKKIKSFPLQNKQNLNFYGKITVFDEYFYEIKIHIPVELSNRVYKLVAIDTSVDQILRDLPHQSDLSFEGQLNLSGAWILVEIVHPSIANSADE